MSDQQPGGVVGVLFEGNVFLACFGEVNYELLTMFLVLERIDCMILINLLLRNYLKYNNLKRVC